MSWLLLRGRRIHTIVHFSEEEVAVDESLFQDLEDIELSDDDDDDPDYVPNE